MAFSVGGSQNLGGSGGGDQRRMLPPGFPSQKAAPSPYQGFAHPPLYDAGRGHNLPLVPDILELGMFTIQENGIKDDYLLCGGFDPKAKKFYYDLPVAKPRLLQKTPFDRQTFERDGRVFTLYYPAGPGWRVRVEGTALQSDVAHAEKIDEDYFVGDVIVAARTSYEGQSHEEDGVIPRTEDGLLIDWMDLNVGARRWAPAFWDSMMMLFIDESSPYLPRQEYVRFNSNGSQTIALIGSLGAQVDWERDLSEWNMLVQSRGLPRWGVAFCDVPIEPTSQPNLNAITDNAAPFGVPAGITNVAILSRNVSGQNMIDAYREALRNPEGFDGLAPPSVLVMIDISGSMTRALLSDGLSEFKQWLGDGAGVEGGYPVTLNERTFNDERWLRFLVQNIRETRFGV